MERQAAAAIATVHCGLVVLVVSGSVAAIFGLLRRRPGMSIALSLLLSSLILSDVLTGGCLLTTWEVNLLNQASPGSAYQGSFLDHYFGFVPPWFHAKVGPPIVVCGFLAAPFWLTIERRRRKRTSELPLAAPPESSAASR
jgi:hypothetical protein